MLDTRQRTNIVAALHGVKHFRDEHGYSEKVAKRHGRLVIMTMLVEGGGYNYANANVHASMVFPHDRVGFDHDSVGIVQQRVSGTWFPADTIAKKMLPGYAARGFLHRLRELGLDRYAGPPLGVRCQRVQVSAFPGRYALQSARALLIRRKYWAHA